MNDYVRLHYLAALGRDLSLPEPPRATTIRVYSRKRSQDRFRLFGDGLTWVSCADVLDLKLNYWEKTVVPGETFYYGDGLLHLVADTDELKWYYDLAFINCGPKYKEDQYDHDKLQRARNLVNIKREIIEEKVILSLAGV